MLSCGASAASPWTTDANVVNLVTDGDTVTIGSATAGGKLFIDGDADEIQFQVQGNATQTANLLTLEQSDGTDVFTVSNAGNTAIAGDLNVDTNVLGVSAANNSLGINTAAGTAAVMTIATSAAPGLEIYGTGVNDLDIASDSNVSIGLDEDNNDSGEMFNIFSNAGADTIFSVTESDGRGVAFIQGWLRLGVDTTDVADTDTLTPGASYVEATCTTATNCTITLDDTTSSQGQALILVSMDPTNTITLNTVAGQQQIGGGTVNLGQYDTIMLMYLADRWVQLATSDNT